MPPRPRTTSIAASVALIAGVLAGCSDPDPDPAATDETPPSAPSRNVDDSALPTGSDLSAWATSALPANSPGGPAEVERASGEVIPGTDTVIDLAQPEGQWQLTIVCQSVDGSAMTLIPAPVATNELQPLQCASPGGAAVRGDLGSIGFTGGDDHTVSLRTAVPAVYVYKITPQSTPQD